MFEHLKTPEDIVGPAPARCARKATGVLGHSADRSPVAACKTERGAKVFLCAGCLAAVKAWQWLRKTGTTHPGQYEIRAAAEFLAESRGYVPPTLGQATNKRVEAIWRLLKAKEAKGFVRALRREKEPTIFFIPRDPRACLDCGEIEGHLNGCGLVIDWPERRKVRVG